MITSGEAIKRLQELENCFDTEEAHIEADGILCELLDNQGYVKVTEIYHKLKKWYS